MCFLSLASAESVTFKEDFLVILSIEQQDGFYGIEIINDSVLDQRHSYKQ